MKKTIIISLFILSGFPVSARVLPDDDSALVIRRISEAASRVTSLECDFIQTRHISLLSSDMQSTGRLDFIVPDKLRWEYVTPENFVFILNGNSVALQKKGKTEVSDANRKKMFREIARMMMNNLTGKSLADEKSFGTEVSAEGSQWKVTLFPLKKELKQFLSRFVMYYDEGRTAVVKVEIYEQSGDFTTIQFNNHKNNKTLEDGLFRTE